MEFLMLSFLMLCKLLPVLIFIAIAFYINRTLGIVISVFFLLVIVSCATYAILQKRNADERYQQNLKKAAVYASCILVVVLALVACIYIIIKF